jgi:hypothetical protein
MTESTNNRVIINDFDFQTMQELLRFIYCGEVLNLKEVALELLQAADKVSKCYRKVISVKMEHVRMYPFYFTVQFAGTEGNLCKIVGKQFDC